MIKKIKIGGFEVKNDKKLLRKKCVERHTFLIFQKTLFLPLLTVINQIITRTKVIFQIILREKKF